MRRWNRHVVSVPGKMSGAPCVEGTRITAVSVARVFRDECGPRMGVFACREWWPELTADQILACVEHCEGFREMRAMRKVVPLHGARNTADPDNSTE